MKLRRLLKIAAVAVGVLIVILVLVHRALIHEIGGASMFDPRDYLKRLSPAAVSMLEAAYSDLDAELVFDGHVHLPGLGTDASGCRLNAKMQSWAHPRARVQFLIYADAARIRDLEHADRQYVERLVDLAHAISKHGKLGLLAFDAHYSKDGTLVEDETEMFTPNDWPVKIALEFPDLFTPIASVHPYRRDAVQELARAADMGCRIVKWLPNAMGIDPASDRCDPFYDAMARRGMVLLSHAGEEHAVDADDAQEFGNPLRLRRALDRGVKVIVAHCASLGEGDDLDAEDGRRVENFDLFLRLMDDPRYVGKVFGEISAITQTNRAGRPLATMLERTDLHERLVNGTDYPLPAINALFSTRQLERRGYITAVERTHLNELYDVNPLAFDLVLKRTVKHPTKATKFPASVFMTRAGLTR